jgi:hypothetical protein
MRYIVERNVVDRNVLDRNVVDRNVVMRRTPVVASLSPQKPNSNSMWDLWCAKWHWETCILDSHLHRVTHTGFCFDTFDSPDDEHEVARNM